MRFTIHRSASSGVMFNFSASIVMDMHWWIRQNVSKIIRRELPMKSSRQATWCPRYKSPFSLSLTPRTINLVFVCCELPQLEQWITQKTIYRLLVGPLYKFLSPT
jgi:hypothetical protein